MTLRFGVLGCARIVPFALVRPARKVREVEITAIGSRSTDRARRWARRHHVPQFGTYEDVISSPDVDAVYVPLPNSMHAEWAIRALNAGKHVLCEKPLAATERDAQAMADAARSSGRVGMEAFHYQHHPLFQRVKAIVDSGELGELRRVDFSMSVPAAHPRDVRWDPQLAGGATMDVGCYGVNAARVLAGAEPEVLTASGAITRGGVDRSFQATLAFTREVESTVRGSIFGPPQARLEVTGTRGWVNVWNPVLPQIAYRLRVKVDGAERRETVADSGTYVHQLRAFVAAVRDDAEVVTSFDNGVGNMRLLDQIRSILGVRDTGPHRRWLRRAS